MYEKDRKIRTLERPSAVRRSLALRLDYQVSPEVGIYLSAPYEGSRVRRTLRRARVEYAEDGLGDASMGVIWRPWTAPAEGDHVCTFLEAHHLSFTVGLKLPTGRDSDEPESYGVWRQTGTGTLDILLGAVFAPPLTRHVRLFGAAAAAVPSGRSTSAAFRRGSEGTLKLGVSVRPVERVEIFGSADWRWRDRDRFGTLATIWTNSGGWWLDATAGAAVRLGAGWSVEGSVSIPAARWVRGQQLVPAESWRLSIAKRF